MSDTVSALEQQRASLLQQISQLPDLRPGSITVTAGRCGNPTGHCHRPNDPGHSPHLRLTYKLDGKTVTESFSSPAAQRKTEQEIAAFRDYQQLSRKCVAVNEKICRVRPVEDTLTPEGKKRPTRSSKRSTRK